MAHLDNLTGLDKLIDALPHAVLVVGPDGVIEHGNVEAERLFGAGRGSLAATHIDSWLPTVSGGEHFALASAAEGPHQHHEVAVPQPGGGVRWFEVGVSRLGPDGGRLIVHLGDVTERRDAQEALARSERYLREAFENLPISIWVEDFTAVKLAIDRLRAEGTGDLRSYLRAHPEVVWQLVGAIDVIDVNERSVHFLGASSKEALSHDIGSYMTPLSLDTLVEEFASLSEGRVTYEGELPVRNARGEAQVLRLFVAIAPGHEHDWARVLVSFVDVTEQRLAERSLREATEQLESILDATGLGLYRSDLRANHATPDERYLRMLGYTAEEFGHTFDDLLRVVHPDDVPRLKATFDRLGELRSWDDQEFRMRHKAGHHIWVRDVGRVVHDEHGPSQVLGFHQDVTERHLSQAREREARDRYQAIVDNATIGIWSMDAGHRTTFVNQRMADMLGYSPEELLGRAVEDFMYPDDLRDHARKMERRHQGAGGAYERRFLRKDGTTLYTEVSGIPLRDATGAFVGSFGLFTDITQKKVAEEKRRESEERYTTLFRSTTLGIAVTRVSDGVLLEVNDAFARILGYAPEAMVGRTSKDLDLWVDQEQRVRLLEDVLQSRVADDQEVQLRRKDGSVAVVLMSGGVVDLNGESCVISMHHDITSRREAERDAREHQERYQTLVRMALDGIIVVSADGRITEANDAYCRMTGFTPEQLAAMHINAVDATESPERTAEHIRQIKARGWDRFETRHHRVDGGLVDVEVSNVFVPSSGQFLCFIRDLSASKRAEEALRQSEDQLRQSQKMEAVGRLAGGVAHDFNNLLTVINANAEVAMGLVRTGDPLHSDLSEIRKAAGRASTLTRQLLAFSRRQFIQPRVIGLNEVVSELEKMLRRLIGEDIELVALLSQDLHNIRADAGQVEQLLVNLAVNARDAMPRGGRLTIRTANSEIREPRPAQDGDLPAGHYVRLTVSDTGHGMDPEVQQRIFEPFYTTKDKQGGTGLGLAMVYGIVKQSGGNIVVHSTPGAGSTFDVYFPREVALREVEPVAAARPPRAKGGETVLLVEDEEAVRSLLQRVLISAGYRVLSASNGGEALLICEKPEPVDLLLTDVIMPRMSGKELADRLTAMRPGLKVLFASGYTDDALEPHGVRAAGQHFLAKPFNVSDLRRKIREVLDEPV